MGLSRKDAVLRAQALNFASVLAASPGTYNQTAATATDVTAAVDGYVEALDALTAARANSVRSGALADAKNSARLTMLNLLRPIYAYVQDSTVIPDAAKTSLGVHIRQAPTTVPVPSQIPAIDVVSVFQRTVTVRVHGDESNQRAKPIGCHSVNLFSYVGEAPPNDPALWHFEGGSSRIGKLEVAFPASVPAGSQVWFCAQWLNSKAQSGAASEAIGTTLAGGSAAPMSVKLAA